MEEFEQEPSDKFTKAFNAGYQLSKHEPKLLDDILINQNHHNEFIKALSFGKRQQQKEELIQKQKDALKKKNKMGR